MQYVPIRISGAALSIGGGLRDNGIEPQAEALKRAEALRPVFAELAGLSHRAAAKALNERGIKTATGKAWTAVQVIRVRERLTSHLTPDL